MKEIKKNNKGFTLVELLVVLVILTVIMAIAIPSITSTLERSKEKERNSKIKLIESAAEIYVDKNKNIFPNGGRVSVQTLVNEGELTPEEAKDPSTNKTIAGCVIFTSNSSTGTYSDSETDCTGAK